jgi:hypothetical protein
MGTIHIKAELSYNELLSAVDQLNPNQLEKFVDQVIALRAKKKGKNLSKGETALLLKINQKIDPDIQKRYDALSAKRRKETLTAEEEKELLKLTDKIEKMETKRVEYLSQLAQFRNTSLIALMKNLDIQTPPYV